MDLKTSDEQSKLAYALAWAKKTLQVSGITASEREARDLLAFALSIPGNALDLDEAKQLTSEQSSYYRHLIARRAKNEPFAYLTGRIDFLGCPLTITRDVLIPRQETEIFVTKVLAKVGHEEKIAWDLCSGSGCIALALKKARPNLQVTGMDISPLATQVAQHNACQCDLDVSFLVSDLFSACGQQKTDYVTCNPPYVSEKEYARLEPEVRLFEPKIALVAQSEGYAIFQQLADQLPDYLRPNAKIFLEIGAYQEQGLRKIFHQKYWKQVHCMKDWAGMARFFFLEFSG